MFGPGTNLVSIWTVGDTNNALVYFAIISLADRAILDTAISKRCDLILDYNDSKGWRTMTIPYHAVGCVMYGIAEDMDEFIHRGRAVRNIQYHNPNVINVEVQHVNQA